MNLAKLLEWIVGIVLIFAATGHLGVLQHWIWTEQAKMLYAARPATWGDPNFLKAKL